MKRIVIALFMLCSWPVSVLAGDCPIFPIPKEYSPIHESWSISPGTVIVCDGKTPQEQYAAQRLQEKVQLRFGITIPVTTSQQAKESVTQIVLGVPQAGSRLERLLKASNLTVNETAPGFNGYQVACVREKGNRRILLAGSDVNGVIYGQESLFDMMKKVEGEIRLEAANIRDWPSIPWRGRPHSVLEHHLRTGELDGYVRARLNYSDVRDNPEVPASLLFDARKASMGIPPGKKMDTQLMARMIKESHRRGIFIYGTVSCSITLDQFNVLQKTYDELLRLGVDGLWVSMDDTGGGNDPVELVRRIVAYCKSRGIKGNRIAFTPPPAEYQNIDKPLNREMAKVSGFDDAVWFFTRVPCKADREMAKAIGLKCKPAWWYNYVETGEYDGKCGFLNTSYLVTTLRRNGRPGYIDLQPLRWGWGFPEYDKIRDAANNTDHVHMWGLCGGWPTEYALANIGLWGWGPKTFDWDKFKRSAYRYIYGDPLVDTMCQFDAKLDELKQYFRLAPGWRYNPAEQWPQLKDVKTRPEVLRRIDELKLMAGTISKEAVKESALDRARLEYQYLEPMRTSLVYAEKYATFDYLDYRYGTLLQELDALFFEGNNAQAAKLLQESVPVIRKNLDAFKKTFAELKGTELYEAKWLRIASMSPKEWTQAQREKIDARWKTFSAISAEKLLPYLKEGQQETLASLFKNYEKKPQGNILARIEPAQWLKGPVCIRGNSLIGLYRYAKDEFVGIGLPQSTPTVTGDAAMIRVECPVPKFEKRLYARFYAGDTRVDHSAPGYRSMKLMLNGREIWREDVALDQRGKEWRRVDLTEMAQKAEKLQFQFVVDELRPVGHHSSMEFLGTLYLTED